MKSPVSFDIINILKRISDVNEYNLYEYKAVRTQVQYFNPIQNTPEILVKTLVSDPQNQILHSIEKFCFNVLNLSKSGYFISNLPFRLA